MPHVQIRCALVAALALFAAGCGGGQEKEAQTQTESPAAMTLVGPQIVQDMIAAHGGMATWKNAPTFSFTEQWGDRPPSRFVVEQNSRRVYMDTPATGTSLAWDGEKAWSLNWSARTPPRFLALLNYYFIDIPWLTQDPGVKLAEPETGTLPGESTQYATVMMTFMPGTGDTPDDYYRLYINPETKMLRAVDYVVTYQALMPEGHTSSPEHRLVYDGMTEVDGLKLPSHFTIYENNEVYAACAISDYSLSAPFDEARMTMPEGAHEDTSTP